MNKWADYLISEVSYNPDHLISVATCHQDTDKGITKGIPVDRITIASNIKNGLFYISIYRGKNSWKKGFPIQTFSIEGNPYLRIDGNKVKLDYLGDLPEVSILKSESGKKLESPPEPPEEEATPEQLARLEQLERQIHKLKDVLDPELNTSLDKSPNQFSKIEESEKYVETIESIDVKHEIIQTLQKQAKKLDDIEKRIHYSTSKKDV